MGTPLDAPRSIKLRQWLWKEMPNYNGFDHSARVRGWQLVHLLAECGQLPPLQRCCITGVTDGLSWHAENYYDWRPYPLTQKVHFALHRRFNRPDEWRAIVDRFAINGGEWFATLSPAPVDLAGDLRRRHGEDLADIFARAPIPRSIWIDPTQIHAG